MMKLNQLVIFYFMPGDTYIRLFDESGVDIIRNDDGSCGPYTGSRLYYTVVDKGFHPCRYYYLVQGCYNAARCGGTAYITVLGSGHPTSIPSGEPSAQPTSFPSSPTSQPTNHPSGEPSGVPSAAPSSSTGAPSSMPSVSPSTTPSSSPTALPSEPTPSSQPSLSPAVDDTVTVLLAVLLPLGTLFLILGSFFIYRHYSIRYMGRFQFQLHPNDSHKVRCISSSVQCKYNREQDKNENILTHIDLFEEF